MSQRSDNISYSIPALDNLFDSSNVEYDPYFDLELPRNCNDKSKSGDARPYLGRDAIILPTDFWSSLHTVSSSTLE